MINQQQIVTNSNHKTFISVEDLRQTEHQAIYPPPALIQSITTKQEISNKSESELLKYFEKYVPESDLDLKGLKSSPSLKIQKFKDCYYYGSIYDHKKHGLGILVYTNGRIYEGSFQHDFKHGKGYQKFANLSKYQGFYVNGKPQGVGTYIWHTGQFYQGEWINGLKHGSGMWRGDKGDSYIGQWKFGKADGYGVHTWANGDRYQGQFKLCLKHGEGTQKFANGDIYIGSYINGKPQGYGQYYWLNGSYFKGNFKNGLRHGNGIWKKGAGNSDKYEGQYRNDKKFGYGIFTWASGNIYKGNYLDDVRHGYGQMYWVEGSYYKGAWENGIQHGQGQINIPGQYTKKGIFEQNVLIHVLQEIKLIDHQKSELKQEEEQYFPQQNVQFQQQNQRSRQSIQFVTQKISRSFKTSKNLNSSKILEQNPRSKRLSFNATSQIYPMMIMQNSNNKSGRANRNVKNKQSSFSIHKIELRPNTHQITRKSKEMFLNKEQIKKQFDSRRIQTGQKSKRKIYNIYKELKNYGQNRLNLLK